MGLESGADGPSAGARRSKATATAAPVGPSLAIGALVSGAFHVALVGLTLLQGRAVQVPFAGTEGEPAIVILDIASIAQTTAEVTAVSRLATPVPSARRRLPRPAVCCGTSAHRRTAVTAAAHVSEVGLSPPPLAASELTTPPAPLTGREPEGAMEGGDNGSDDDERGEEMESPPAATSAPEAPIGPPHVAASVAAALRLYDHFPRIPEPLRGRTGEHAMTVDVCVSERGHVSQVNISPTGLELLERTLREAVQTWRYRPLMVGGAPRPFCHMLRVVYRNGSV
jgi:hypothetical protein